MSIPRPIPTQFRAFPSPHYLIRGRIEPYSYKVTAAEPLCAYTSFATVPVFISSSVRALGVLFVEVRWIEDTTNVKGGKGTLTMGGTMKGGMSRDSRETWKGNARGNQYGPADSDSVG
jgi:hypothetical protein